MEGPKLVPLHFTVEEQEAGIHLYRHLADDLDFKCQGCGYDPDSGYWQGFSTTRLGPWKFFCPTCLEDIIDLFLSKLFYFCKVMNDLAGVHWEEVVILPDKYVSSAIYPYSDRHTDEWYRLAVGRRALSCNIIITETDIKSFPLGEGIDTEEALTWTMKF